MTTVCWTGLQAAVMTREVSAISTWVAQRARRANVNLGMHEHKVPDQVGFFWGLELITGQSG